MRKEQDPTKARNASQGNRWKWPVWHTHLAILEASEHTLDTQQFEVVLKLTIFVAN